MLTKQNNIFFAINHVKKFEKLILIATLSLSLPSSLLIGSFSIDDGNGSENVSFKMNFRFFNLCRVYSNLLKMLFDVLVAVAVVVAKAP